MLKRKRSSAEMIAKGVWGKVRRVSSAVVDALPRPFKKRKRTDSGSPDGADGLVRGGSDTSGGMAADMDDGAEADRLLDDEAGREPVVAVAEELLEPAEVDEGARLDAPRLRLGNDLARWSWAEALHATRHRSEGMDAMLGVDSRAREMSCWGPLDADRGMEIGVAR